MKRRDGRRSGRWIRGRVLLLVSLGMLGPFGLLAWSSWHALAQVDRRSLAHDAALARIVAERISGVLAREMAALQSLASEVVEAEGDAPRVNAAVRHALVHQHELLDEVFVLGPDGHLLALEPRPRATLDGRVLAAQLAAIGHATFGSVNTEADGHRAYALTPADRRPGERVGIVGATLQLDGDRGLQALLSIPDPVSGPVVEVLDADGVVLASTDPSRRFARAAPAAGLATLLRERRPATGGCLDCGRKNSVLPGLYAFQPTTGAHWGVLVREARAAAGVLGPGFGREVALLAVVLVALTLLFAWGASASITRPVSVLRAAAERLAEGQLGEAIPPLPDDEVGRLGTALDRMRVALKESLERVERANTELDARVRERTDELVHLNARLAERDGERRAALVKVISAQEDERRRISRELHDETSQTLAALRLALESALPAVANDAARLKVEEARTLAARTLEGVHRVMVDLRPSVLDDLGLPAAIEWYADRALRPRHITVHCEFDGLDGRFAPEVETAVFRATQEALSNVARHSGADSVLVQGTLRSGHIVMEIEDDGTGFDRADLPPLGSGVRGLGLLGMRERMELVGGTFTLDSAPGEGTRVVLDIPVPADRSVPHG